MSAPLPWSPELAALVAALEVGPARSLRGVFLVPLLRRAAHGADVEADLLEDGVAARVTEVREVSESGVVNLLRVEHRGTRPLLLVDGEQVVGGKQNRIMNASFLVPPGATVDVPVSCVEQGRWAHKSAFTASGTTLSSRSRTSKLRRVTESVRTGRGYDAGQREVWTEVTAYLETTGVHSGTMAFDDAARTRTASVDDDLAAVAPLPGQLGVALVDGGRVTAIDLFGSAGLWSRAWQKVLRGVLLDLDPSAPAPAACDAERLVQAALAALSSASGVRQSAPGTGETLHGTAPGYSVGAVTDHGSVYHAVVAAA